MISLPSPTAPSSLPSPSRPRWRVMKFGGTSLAGAERLRSAVRLARAGLSVHRVLVVASAMAGVTDLLVAGIAAAEAGDPAAESAARFLAVHGEALALLRAQLGAQPPGAADRRPPRPARRPRGRT